VPTPEDFPQANRSIPKARKANLNLINLLILRRSSELACTCPLFVPMFLQLTFRVVKVKPSDAAIKATIVPASREALNREVCLVIKGKRGSGCLFSIRAGA